MVWKKVGGQPKKARPKRFPTLRMMKRGWTQPDEKMTARITEAAIRKAVASVIASGAFPMAIMGKVAGTAGDKAILREIAVATARMGKKQQRIALGVVSNAATKYALDAVGIADRKKRGQARALMKEAVETMLLGSDVVSKHHYVEVLGKVQELLGARGRLFIVRYLWVSNALVRELEKSGVFKGD